LAAAAAGKPDLLQEQQQQQGTCPDLLQLQLQNCLAAAAGGYFQSFNLIRAAASLDLPCSR
jgi:hypothetical protein